MPSSDILNPTAIWEDDIQDSMCPNYGFPRKRAGTQLRKKAVGGTPWSRETANTGHTFTFSWIGRSYACVQRLKWYYEQYEDGFFTIIDWDGGGRHYVGHFTSEVAPVETGNGMWDVQNVTFEEIPIVAMEKYPSDWDHDSIRFYVLNDYGDQKVATSGTWTQTARTIEGVDCTTLDNAGDIGDWAQFEYRGYGFKLYMLQGPDYGKAEVLLDGVTVAKIDCYDAAELGPQMVYMEQNVSLDFHRVKVAPLHPSPVISLATPSVLSTILKVSWHSIEVMR
jgi:hypothetical protein